MSNLILNRIRCLFKKSEITNLNAHLRAVYKAHLNSLEHYGVIYHFNRDNEYWTKAAKFWQQHGSMAVKFYEDTHTVVMGKSLRSYSDCGSIEVVQTIEIGDALWYRYNYGSSELNPFGELVRIDQVFSLLEMNPQWRLPTDDEFLAFADEKNFSIESNIDNIVVRCNRTAECLLFPSANPKKTPLYWSVTYRDYHHPQGVYKSDPHYLTIRMVRGGFLKYHLGDKRYALLSSDLDAPRALLRLIKREPCNQITKS